MKYLIRLRFDGTAYCGWQMQKNGLSVQECVMNAVRRVFGEVRDFSGCSRTDSGVHADDFRVSYSSEKTIPCDRVPAALNSVLPRDIAVYSAQPVPESFHARYDTVSKEYRYRIDPSRYRSPFLENRAWHRPGEYEIEKMNAAASRFVGTHDFSSFMAAGSRIADCTRTVFFAHWEMGETLDFTVSANGFLYHMVRIFVGTLVLPRVWDDPTEIDRILAERNRCAAGPTAPACGLYLHKVTYPSEAFLPE